MQKQSAFSLVEITLAIGIIAFSLVAILALIPVGMKSGGEAIDATRTSLAVKDSQNRVKSSVTSATFTNASDINLPTWFYDRDGVFVDTATNGFGKVFYRADSTIKASWGSGPPPNVDATVLRPVTLQLRWPLNPADGSPLGSNAASFTFYVRRP